MDMISRASLVLFIGGFMAGTSTLSEPIEARITSFVVSIIGVMIFTWRET